MMHRAIRHLDACGVLVRMLLLMALVALQFAAPRAGAQGPMDDTVTARRVKAAYLYRFAGYVEWPEGAFSSPDAALLIGIWDDDEFADDLARLVANRTANGRRVEVRRLNDKVAPVQVHVLFVPRERAGQMPQVLESLEPRGLLMVTEWPGALGQGSVINFVTSASRIQFELSLDTADKYELKLSSRLIAVARNAGGGPAR